MAKRGRHSLQQKKDTQRLIVRALKEIYSNDNTDYVKVCFIKDLLAEPQGRKFIAEHLFGKAPENLNVLDITETKPEKITFYPNEQGATIKILPPKEEDV